MSTPKITFHLLENSRGHRILWLLEELELDYELKTYKRNEENRADSALAKIHPFGKSPILVVDGEVLVESGYIIDHLLSEFDTAKKLAPISKKDKQLVDFYLHYTEGTVQPLLTQFVIFDTARAKAPYLKRAICSTVCTAIEDGYPKPELENNLKYLEHQLSQKSSSGLFFVGDKLSGADIILLFTIEAAMSGKGGVFDKKKYPNITKWAESMTKRPAFLKANGKSKLVFK